MNILIKYMKDLMNKVKNLINKIKNYFVKKNVKSKKVSKKS
jgi:hypothetical protein